jgi:hypothetical protein
MDRPTREDAHFRAVLIHTGIALLIAAVLLIVAYLWLFKRLLS